MVKTLLYIAFGGALGSVCRFLISLQLAALAAPFWATLTVNVLGSFLIGIIVGMGFNNNGYLNSFWALSAIGFCGGFTTFSTFALENIQFLKQGQYLYLLFYILSSLFLGLLSCWVGILIVK